MLLRQTEQNPGELVLSQAARSLLEASAKAVFLMELNQRFIACNAAGRMLMESDILTIDPVGRLAAGQEQGTRTLRAGLAKLEAQSQRDTQDMPSERLAIRWSTHKADAEPLYGTLMTLVVNDRRVAPGKRRVAILTLVRNRAVPALGIDFLMSMFGLTPAEARLSLLLLEGNSPQFIARGHRVSIETIRVQLKSIFAKTHTHRQSELMALLILLTCF